MSETRSLSRRIDRSRFKFEILRKAAMMKVLLATDGSRFAEYAEQQMTALLPTGEQDLSIVTVCPAVDLLTINYEFPVGIQETVTHCRNEAEGLVERARDRLKFWAKSVGTVVDDGHVASEILREIESSEPDLCVLGSHGRSAIDRFLIGSVSDRVCKYAGCSLLLARPTEDGSASRKIANIVIADDGTSSTQAAISRVREFNNEDLTIHLVTVIPDPLPTELVSAIELESWVRESESQHRSRLQEFAEQLRPIVKDVTIEIRQSARVADELVQVAEGSRADLIMLGGKKKSTLSRILLGSVSLNVLHHVHCSVWIER